MKEKLTPIEKLTSNKARIKYESRIVQDRLSGNLQYLQKNAGKLAVHGVTSAILPNRSSGSGITQSKSGLPSTLMNMALGGASTYLGAKSGILPMAIKVAQPLLLTWGIKGAKNLIGKLFSRKNKKKKKK